MGIEQLAQNEYSVLPSRFSHLGQKEQQYFTDLQHYQAPCLYEKLLQENQIASPDDYNHRFTEFKKYVALLFISQEPLGMISPKIDTLWHQFILFTRQYHEFGQQFYGRYIHHEPTTSLTPLNPKSNGTFEAWYHKVYGCLPDVWNE